MEDAIHFLSKDTVVQAMSRSATKVCLFVFVLLRYLYTCFCTFLHFSYKTVSTSLYFACLLASDAEIY
jgi:hypothetical protein